MAGELVAVNEQEELIVKAPVKLVVPPDCAKVPVRVPSPMVIKSALIIPELNVTAPLLVVYPTFKPADTFKVPPLILTLPPEFNKPALAVTV